jgi:mRNA interferase MazF
MAQEIRRGEIYWVDWSPQRGSEQAGKRPAIIIQNNIGNKYSPTTIVACCSTATYQKSYPFIVSLTAQESGLPKDCSVNLSAILTIDKSRLGDKCGELGEKKMLEIDKAIRLSLALENPGDSIR